MIISWLILTLALAMVFFYFQATCQKVLRRQFDREYFQTIATVIRLEFPSLRKSLAEAEGPVDYGRSSKALKCDFLALTHLLKNTGGVNQRHSIELRLLVLYFRVQFLSLAMRRLLKVREKRAALRLMSVLQYFANVMGQRLCADEIGKAGAGCLVNL